MLEKSIHGLFQHAKQKTWFLLCFIFQTLNAFEKWRYAPVPHRSLLKNEFFNKLLETETAEGLLHRSGVTAAKQAHVHEQRIEIVNIAPFLEKPGL